nr:hypothetical protein B0A51_14374 [Rachicladosporium sp. CCFEE 5018]
MSSLRNAGVYSRRSTGYGSLALRPAVLAIGKLLAIPVVSAAPLVRRSIHILEKELHPPADAAELWINLSIAVALVLAGGVFAGLTIALMGQDETYLQVIASSGEGKEKHHAQKVLDLLARGKHWLLVTLLLSNVITNETLPIVLDRSLGGGWPAVVGSTVLIVIFGEVAPQSVCVRYGLSIGAFMAPMVRILMWIMSPVAWPTAKLLDYLLGKDHGTMYSKGGLKTLVQLHKGHNTKPGEGLMKDEVTIINSVLDLKEKHVCDIMTPMQDVFTMSADTVLDEKMMDTILSQGYSRIPIYHPDNKKDFIGMLLVKILITYDPEDAKRVGEFSLATLPETAPDTSCLDIINYFQEGKSHMVLVSDFPGDVKGALGVVTLEDVIEELIGEEIIDESDVFIDIHKAIRRATPAPRAKYPKHFASEVEPQNTDERTPLLGDKEETIPLSRKTSLVNGNSTTWLMHRKSSNASESTRDTSRPVQVRSTTQDMRKQLQHLGPSNMASKPRQTKYTAVKIKPGVGTIPENKATTTGIVEDPARERSVSEGQEVGSMGAGEGAGMLKDAGKDARDGIQALQSVRSHSQASTRREPQLIDDIIAEGGEIDASQLSAGQASRLAEIKTSPPPKSSKQEDGNTGSNGNDDEINARPARASTTKDPNFLSPDSAVAQTTKEVIRLGENAAGETDEDDEVGTMDAPSCDRSKNRRSARSGSITETTVDYNGFKKTVLETTSSSDDETGEGASQASKKASPPRPSWLSLGQAQSDGPGQAKGEEGKAEGAKKKKKNHKKKKAKKEGE